MKPLHQNAKIVSDFLVKLTTDLLHKKGVQVGYTDLGVLTAGKKITPGECPDILRATFQRLVEENPELIGLMLDGASETVKAKIRKTMGMAG